MAAEDQAQELLMRAGEAGVRIVVDVARLGVGRLFDVLGIGVRAAGESLRHLRDAGRVSVRCLQRMGVFCQIFVGRFGVSFSPFERLFLGRFGFGQSCGLSVIA